MREFFHVLTALAFQIVIGLLTGDYFTGGALAVSFYAGREVRQAQELYLKRTGVQIDVRNIYLICSPKAWTVDSFVLDLVLPALACALFYHFTLPL